MNECKLVDNIRKQVNIFQCICLHCNWHRYTGKFIVPIFHPNLVKCMIIRRKSLRLNTEQSRRLSLRTFVLAPLNFAHIVAANKKLIVMYSTT